MAGYLIAVEGIDGAGKSTLANKLAARLRALGYEVVLTREPTALPTGQILRQRLLATELGDANLDAELFFADRVAHNEAVIKPALNRGNLVITDRYEMGTLAYQSLQGKPLHELLARAQQLLDGGLVMPATIHLLVDVPGEIAVSRLGSRSVRHKFETPAFLEQLRTRYLEVHRHMRGPVAVLDGTLEASALLLQAERACQSLLAGAAELEA